MLQGYQAPATYGAHRTAEKAAMKAPKTTTSRGHAIAASIIVTAAINQCIVVNCTRTQDLELAICSCADKLSYMLISCACELDRPLTVHTDV